MFTEHRGERAERNTAFAGATARVWPSRGSRGIDSGIRLLVASVLALGVVAATGAPAHAAPGDPFDPDAPTVFVAQDSPTQLFSALTSGAGTTSFVPEGSVASVTYNAIAFNPVDDFIYAMSNTAGTDSNGDAVVAGSLLRVGQDGDVTLVASGLAPTRVIGLFGADGLFYVGRFDEDSLQRIDVSTGTIVSTLALSVAPFAADLTLADGFFWGASDTSIVRVNPVSGVVTFFPGILPGGVNCCGAVWTYGNGNLGLQANSTGEVIQVEVDDPASVSPVFTVVGTNPGPPTSNNDGTSIAGAPADIEIVKTASSFVAGEPVSYTLTVTNNGAGVSSGFVVADTVPAPLTNVRTSDAGCTVAGSTVTCVSGVLTVGQTRSFTIEADTPSTMAVCVNNTATVLGNESDPVSANNSSTARSCPPALAATGANPESLIAVALLLVIGGMALTVVRVRSH